MPRKNEKREARLGARWWLRRGFLFVAVAGFGGAVVFGTVKLLEYRAPFVDLDARGGEAPAPSGERERQRLRFAVATMVTPENTFEDYGRLVDRIGRDVGRESVFVIPPTYAEARAQLEKGEVDVAFVCTGTYARAAPRGRLRLLAQPEFVRGREYTCIFLVPADSPYRKLEDLRGGAMAFTDPESNTGRVVPCVTLAARGYDPETFFGKIVYTRSHDRSITAVAAGLVDCAAVDSLVWEAKLEENPALASRVRVLWQSEPFGPPPVVVPSNLEEGLAADLREAFLALDDDEEGRAILAGLGMERLVPARPEEYDTAIEIYEAFYAQGGPE